MDYRKLNAYTEPDPYLMPRTDDLIDILGGAKYITVLDHSRGYWQIGMDTESIPKTSCVMHCEQFKWVCMSFGLKNAASSFQRMVDKLLAGVPYAHAYLDDITIFSDTFEQHLEHVQSNLTLLKEAG